MSRDSTDVESAIEAAVDDGFDAQTEFLADLVRVPTLMGQEAPGQEMMAEAMAAAGLEVDTWTIDPADIAGLPGYGEPVVPYDDMVNVVGVHRGGGNGARSLILNGHIDVVPTGPAQDWRSHPFDGTVTDGWLHGRGAGDMKAGLVATVWAWHAARAAGVEPAGDVILQSVVEEESTGNGSLACIQRGYTADAALIPEPTSHTYLHAHVGLLWFRIRVVVDIQAHPSLAGPDGTGIEKGMAVYRALKGLEDDWNARKPEFPGFEDVERPISIVMGKIEGGDWPSSLPMWCSMEFRVGLYPGVPVAEVRRAIEACVSETAAADPLLADRPPTVEWFGHAGEGYALQGADAIVDVLRPIHERTFGRDLVSVASGGSSDARVLGVTGGIPSIVYGPYARNIHSFDEAVKLSSVRRLTKSLALFIAAWSG